MAQRLTAEAEIALYRPWRLFPDMFAERCSGGRWRTSPHLTYIARTIAKAVFTHQPLLIINVPPRHGKSWLSSWWTPTWFLENWPDRRVIMTSYGSDLAEEWGRKVRNEFAMNPALHTRLSEDKKNIGEWETSAGGGMVSVGVGGAIVGKGGHLIIVDDPHKNWEEAYSPAIREKVWQWFKSTLWSRREPGCTLIVLMQRWHPDDLTGRLVAQFPDLCQVVRLPAIAEAGDALGRAEGEALDPKRYPLADLQLTKSLDSIAWDAMWQQKPTALINGRVYERFIPLPHPSGNLDPACELVPGLPVHMAIDFNVNPGVHLLLSQYDAHRDRAWTRYEIFKPRLKTQGAMDELVGLFRRLGGFDKWPELVIYGDRSGRSETTTTSETDYDIILRELRKANIPHRMCVPRANPPIKDRMDTVNEALRDSDGGIHYTIHPECRELVRDMEELPTDADGLIDKTNTQLSHSSDAIGYWLHWVRPIRRLAAYRPGRVSV